MSRITSGDDIFFTMTMAGILEKQGHLEDALMIYKILGDRVPRDELISSKIAALSRAGSGLL
ncbi:MAG: hypothetical protein HZB83_03320 [Deltaproteobacteria bacterium]|nr:hypothetical protein [Deltaproteobacteria bacterium]